MGYKLLLSTQPGTLLASLPVVAFEGATIETRLKCSIWAVIKADLRAFRVTCVAATQAMVDEMNLCFRYASGSVVR